MVNILVGLLLWGKTSWESHPFHCDNFAVINVLSNGRERDPYLLVVAHTIRMPRLRRILDWKHIQGKDNIIADGSLACLQILIEKFTQTITAMSMVFNYP